MKSGFDGFIVLEIITNVVKYEVLVVWIGYATRKSQLYFDDMNLRAL